ncbi:uncharacterized protein LOC132552435 [Ylistrum balloti]|uniref:uncharacterized protein LOC132552435 n=1 Tax=Ylistrum balloti TaxID=509963 RepID=UPI0029058B8B|nr:uncharacterized protein LOC132552435 [Ylistrum balloti]
MDFSDTIEDIVHEMCVDVTRDAFAEIAREDTKDEDKESSSVQLFVLGRRKLPVLMPCHAMANRTEMLTPKWRQYLTTPRTCKTDYDLSILHMRDVSLTKNWKDCSPEMEDQELRQKHKERVNLWRTLFTNKKNETYHPCVFRYKATKSLLDFLYPNKKINLENTFEVIDLKDIIPKIVIDYCGDISEAEVADKEMSCKSLTGSKRELGTWDKFLCCFRTV